MLCCSRSVSVERKCVFMFFFFFKQKTAYELRISDRSSDVCSSDLYCCGAYRAMNKAALGFYETVRRDGTQKHIIDRLQTREELYDFLDYHAYEQKLDELFSKE